MRIESNNSKNLEKVFFDLNNLNVKVEKQIKESHQSSQASGLELIGLAIGLVGTTVTIISYLESLEKERYLIYFKKSKTKKLSLSEFSNLSNEEQKSLLIDYTVVIEK